MRTYPRAACAALACGLLAAVCAPGISPAGAATVVAARSASWRPAEVPSPAGGTDGILAAIECTAKSSCTAGGSYYLTAAKQTEAMIVTESSRRWAHPLAIKLPAGAATTGGGATIAAISCPSPTSCVAVGNYHLPTNALHGLITTGHGKSWSRARTPLLPTGSAAAGESYLTGVSCSKPRSCVAVGGYTTTSGEAEAMAETESGGSWRRAVEIRPPANASSSPAALLSAVSCPRAGDCVAVGGYTTKSGNEVAMTAVETGGSWDRAAPVEMPTNAPAEPEAELYSVSCSSDRDCVAVGSYLDTAGRGLPLLVTRSGGHWLRAKGLTGLPTGAARSNQLATLNGVACAGSSCTAVGSYVVPAGVSRAMAVSESHSRWSRAVEVSAPAHAASGTAQNATLFAVACNGATDCTGVGTYVNSALAGAAMAASRS